MTARPGRRAVCGCPRNRCAAFTRRRHRRTSSTGAASITIHQASSPIISGAVTVARSIIAASVGRPARSRWRVLGRAHRHNVRALTTSRGRLPGSGTAPFLNLHAPDTSRDTFVTVGASRVAVPGLNPQQAAELAARRAREGARVAPRMASAGLSASDFRLVVVGHGYARLPRVLYRYCVERPRSRSCPPDSESCSALRCRTAGQSRPRALTKTPSRVLSIRRHDEFSGPGWRRRLGSGPARGGAAR